MEQPTIDYHLTQALSHLEIALNQSIARIAGDQAAKRDVGAEWERFLGEFLSRLREKGKQSGINLLALISFPRMK